MPPPWGRPYHTATGFREMPTVDRLSAGQGTTHLSNEKGPGCSALGRNGVTPSPGLRHHWGEGGTC